MAEHDNDTRGFTRFAASLLGAAIVGIVAAGLEGLWVRRAEAEPPAFGSVFAGDRPLAPLAIAWSRLALCRCSFTPHTPPARLARS
jgi:hypothetical protein